MTLRGRGSLVWLGMILAGLALGGYVVAVWPDTSTRIVRLPYGEAMPKTPTSQPARVAASVADAVYPEEPPFVYELGPAPSLDAVISAPPAVDAG